MGSFPGDWMKLLQGESVEASGGWRNLELEQFDLVIGEIAT
jgi:hypothetical protein